MSSKFKEKLEKYYKEAAKLDDWLEKEGIMYTQYKDGAKDRDVENYDNGEEVTTIKENYIWEAQHFGSERATAWLQEKYPKLFEIADERQKQQDKCELALVDLLGFSINPQEMTPYKLIKIIDTFTKNRSK